MKLLVQKIEKFCITGADSDYPNVRTCEPCKILLVKSRGNVVKNRGNIGQNWETGKF